MKCLCGHGYKEAEEDCVDGEWIELSPQIGEEPFISTSTTTLINNKRGLWDVDRWEKKTIYACPSCGTLKVEL